LRVEKSRDADMPRISSSVSFLRFNIIDQNTLARNRKMRDASAEV